MSGGAVLTSAALAAACSSWNLSLVSFTASSACNAFRLSLSTNIAAMKNTVQYRMMSRQHGNCSAVWGCML